MNILVTGANGFLGKNLIAELVRNEGYNILPFTRKNTEAELEVMISKADFIFHLAGVNRPENNEDFFEGNRDLTVKIIELLMKHKKDNTSLVLSSSIQAEKDNPYGQSKKEAEDTVFEYFSGIKGNAYVYRLPNLFGKWSKPNYNSVVSTFCYNVARDIEIQVNNPEARLKLAYVDDVLEEFVKALHHQPSMKGKFCAVSPVHTISLQELADLINGFKKTRQDLMLPDMNNPLTKKMYSTYLSYLPEDQFSYDLKMNVDERGSFTEVLKSVDRGQVSVNVSKPGITKGNHWHHTKNEKFLVVSGQGVIRFRKLDEDEVLEYHVSGKKFEVVDIPVGYTHSIVNIGETDLVTLMWANELFNPEKPDTYYLEV